jgi:hypothetical protein
VEQRLRPIREKSGTEKRRYRKAAIPESSDTGNGPFAVGADLPPAALPQAADPTRGTAAF